LSAGDVCIKTFLGEITCSVKAREDVCPGVLFIAKRGVVGELSDAASAAIGGVS
jgi:NADH-quinone oxidoreductase subunit G